MNIIHTKYLHHELHWWKVWYHLLNILNIHTIIFTVTWLVLYNLTHDIYSRPLQFVYSVEKFTLSLITKYASIHDKKRIFETNLF